MYSEKLLDHFKNPRNAGELPPPATTVEVSNPVCGDILRLSAQFVQGRPTAQSRVPAPSLYWCASAGIVDGLQSAGSFIPRSTAAIKPSAVCSSASTVTSMPNLRAVADVTGPIEATRTPSRGFVPKREWKFSTVEELVKVIQSGCKPSGHLALRAGTVR